jgi:hypothetical protein
MQRERLWNAPCCNARKETYIEANKTEAFGLASVALHRHLCLNHSRNACKDVGQCFSAQLERDVTHVQLSRCAGERLAIIGRGVVHGDDRTGSAESLSLPADVSAASHQTQSHSGVASTTWGLLLSRTRAHLL